MDHQQVRDLFSAAVDGELDPQSSTQFNDHMAACATCRAEYDAFAGTVRSLASLVELPPPEQFVVKVQQRIRRRSRGRFFSPQTLLTRLPYEWISFLVIFIMLVMYYMVLQSSISVGGHPLQDGGIGAPQAPGSIGGDGSEEGASP